MLDEKDLQAISQLFAQQRSDMIQEMDVRFDSLREEMDVRFDSLREEMEVRVAKQKSEMMHEFRLLMESYFDPKFNYLADGLELLKEKVVGREKLEETSDRLDVLEAVVKVHSREIEKLKKAQ